MPRTTRRSLAEEDTPMRSSPRATTKASTAASGSPAKSRGRRGEKAEDDPAHVAEAEEPVTKKGRGRPASTGRGGRGSRSRGRRGAGDEEEEEVEEKTTPPSTSRRGRGKGKADATPTEDDAADKDKEEEKEEEEKESEEAEEEEEKTPRGGRGRPSGRGRGKSPTAATPKSNARGSRSSRRSGAAEEENEEEEAAPQKEVKTTPTRGRGRGRGGSRSRGRPGRGKAAAEEEGGDEEMDTSITADAEEEKEPAEEKLEPGASKEDAEDKEPEEKQVPEAAKEPEPEPEKTSPAKSAAKSTAAEPMEQETTESESKDVNNGDISDKQEPKKQAGVKRKLEETEAVAEVEQGSKRAKVNGEEPKTTPIKASEVPATVTPQKEATASVDSEISQDFVMVNKEDVPPADSSEVAAALPKPAPILPPTSADVVPMEDAAPIVASASPAVVPLTEAEVAKAYANQIQGKQSEDRDEVSSVVVEVGSVAGSDVASLSVSRGLDTSEVQSASNSIDGDFPDTSITETQASSTPAPPADPAQPASAACQQQSVNVPNPVPVSQASPLNPQSTPFTPQDMPQNTNTSNNGLSDSRGVNPQALAPSVPSAGTAVDNVIPVQNSGCPPSAKSSSSVSDRLGTPDPTFLASYKAPTIFSRAYVPNVAAPPELLDPARTFSVVSYNILAECARQRSDYSYTAPEFLGQEYRHALMMREIQYLNGDVVCMQEVNPAYFNNTLLPDMQKLGYDGLVMKRTKDYFDEGEATFYKVAAFDLECSKGISLAEVARKEVELGGLRPEVGAAVNRYLDRADVVLITKLRSKVTGKSFTIGNIHVVWDQMTSPDVQCIQAACAIKEVVGMAGGEGSPHIICGDFNSEWNSPAYQLVLDGYLSDTSIRKLQAVEKLELAEGSKSLVNHLWRAFQHTSSNLRSSYSTVTGSEPEITTFTRHMHSSVDYIFYSSGSLIPVGVLKTVDKAVIDATGGLPDREFPSDHLAMKAVMAFS